MSVEELEAMGKELGRKKIVHDMGREPDCIECRDKVCLKVENNVYEFHFDEFGAATLQKCKDGGGTPNKSVYAIIMRQTEKIKSIASICLILFTFATISVMMSKNTALETVVAYIENREEREKQTALQVKYIYDGVKELEENIE